MKGRAGLVLLLAALGTLVPAVGSAAEIAWIDIVVRVYPAAPLAPAELQAALAVAGERLAAAGVEVTWRRCGLQASSTGDNCETAAAPGDLAVRIVRSPAEYVYSQLMPLGDALIDTRARRGVLGTVYADRVRWLAALVPVHSSVLLGRAIAHELGHLLLATTEHRPSGLMRGVWSRSELRNPAAVNWSFAAPDVAAIHSRARAARMGARASN